MHYFGAYRNIRFCSLPLVTFATCIIVALTQLFPIKHAQAETLRQALASAYLSNPTLQAERAKLRAIDEEIPRAISGYRPTITGNGDIGSQYIKTRPSSLTDGNTKPSGYSISVRQPLFRGFRTINSVRVADANILAAREDLKRVEQTIFLEVITAYMDVVRDLATVRLRRNNVNVLSRQLNAINNRFAVGEVTKTDVAQAKARRARAVSAVNLAQANLKTSQATYQRVVGHKPRNLRYPGKITQYLPKSLSVALKRGESESPSVLASVYRKQAAGYTVDKIRGEALPELSVEASYQRRFELSKFVDEQETTKITGTLRIPFYQAGELSARVRQARETNTQRSLEIDAARNRVQADIVASWGQLVSSRAQISADRAQVSASRTALEGVRAEEKVGQRTVLDVLDAEQELLDANVALLRSRRDYVVAAFGLLSGTGRLTSNNLNLSVELYDPVQHYIQVKNKWYGFGSGDRSVRDAFSTKKN